MKQVDPKLCAPLLRGIYSLYLAGHYFSYEFKDKAAIKALIKTGHKIGIFESDYFSTLGTMTAQREKYVQEWIRQNTQD